MEITTLVIGFVLGYLGALLSIRLSARWCRVCGTGLVCPACTSGPS